VTTYGGEVAPKETASCDAFGGLDCLARSPLESDGGVELASTGVERSLLRGLNFNALAICRRLDVHNLGFHEDE
jgi:hypothetical protein